MTVHQPNTISETLRASLAEIATPRGVEILQSLFDRTESLKDGVPAKGFRVAFRGDRELINRLVQKSFVKQSWDAGEAYKPTITALAVAAGNRPKELLSAVDSILHLKAQRFEQDPDNPDLRLTVAEVLKSLGLHKELLIEALGYLEDTPAQGGHTSDFPNSLESSMCIGENALDFYSVDALVARLLSWADQSTSIPKLFDQHSEYAMEINAPEQSSNMPRIQRQANNIRLFVSHTSSDTPVVKLLLMLIRSALSLPAKDIRCTSIDGYRLPGGANTDTQLRDEVYGCESFIGIISANSIESMYVLFELGARWGAGKKLIPLLAPGMRPSDLSTPISGLNALRCDSREQLQQLVTDLGHDLGITPENPQVYSSNIDAILELDVPSVTVSNRIELRRESADKLTEFEVEILKHLADDSCPGNETDVETVAGTFSIPTAKARHFLEKMMGEGYLDYGSLVTDEPVKYKIIQRGTEALIQRGFL